MFAYQLIINYIYLRKILTKDLKCFILNVWDVVFADKYGSLYFNIIFSQNDYLNYLKHYFI